MSAQLPYLEAASASCTEARRAELKKKLEDYCALDTLSMVEVARKLIDVTLSRSIQRSTGSG